MHLAELEAGQTGMPTAVFYAADDDSRSYGREAIAAYVDGFEGRLMRSIKSLLGSDLIYEVTELAPRRNIKYVEVVVGYLRHLRELAQRQAQTELTRAVIGRPVFFVDEDAKRDQQAQHTLAEAAKAAGFREVDFQYEPIAAALDYESRLSSESLVMVADIGGGTSDFSIVRCSPEQHQQVERRDDVLANHGVHTAGTDFDRAVNLAALMPLLGFRSMGPQQREVPSTIYFELATWHLINTCYTPRRLAELRQMRGMYRDMQAYERLLQVLRERLGHLLAGKAEQAKIDVALHQRAEISLDVLQAGLATGLNTEQQNSALLDAIERIKQAAAHTVQLAGLKAQDIDAVYFTGGSTGLSLLTDQIAQLLPQARRITGDRFSAVVSGLAISAQRRFS